MNAKHFTNLCAHALLAWATQASLGGCDKDAPDLSPPVPLGTAPSALASDAAPTPAPDPTRLPEDEEAGLRSQQQWREHLAFEEDERQLMFDRQRLKAHAALVALAKRARARLDAARSEVALSAAQKTMPRQVEALRNGVNKLDPWGVNSRLLEDYAWLAATLEGSYAEAKRAALRGDGAELTNLGEAFDARMIKMADWLHRAAESEGEGEEERAREREREREHREDAGEHEQHEREGEH